MKILILSIRRGSESLKIPAHLPVMNPDKALAGWLMKRGLGVAGGGAPAPEMTCTPLNLHLRQRVPIGDGPDSPKYHVFAKNRHYYFSKFTIRHLFGWNRHISGPEITAFCTVWTGDRLTNGLKQVESEGMPVFAVSEFTVGDLRSRISSSPRQVI